MERQSAYFGKYLTILVGILIFAILYLAASNYPGFSVHSLVELFGVIVAGGIFMLAWNSRHFQDNHYFLFIGIAYLFVGSLDVLHNYVYQSVRLLNGSGLNLSVQLRVAARYVESISLLAAPLFAGRKLKTRYVFPVYIAVTSLLLGFIFLWHIFPDCLIQGTGLTRFNTISEFGICLTLVGAIAFMVQKRREFDPGVLWLLIASIALTIGSELIFVFFAYATPGSKLISYALETISYYLIYKAIVETGLMEPYRVLFRNLKQSEESVKAAYAEFEQMFNTTSNAMSLIDKEFTILKANRTFLNLAGLSQDEVIGKKCYDIFPSSACHNHQCVMAKIFRGEERVEFDVEMSGHDGLMVYGLLTATPFRRSDGELIGIVENFKDISERKAMEEKLREERDRAQKYLDVVGVIILIVGADQKVRLINKKGCEILGYGEREILGRNWFDSFVPERVRSEVAATFQKLKSGEIESAKGFENPILAKNGEEKIISWHNTFLRDEKGYITAILTSGEDITDRKLAEEELKKYRLHLEELVRDRTGELTRAVELLRESETKYSTLIEKARDGVMVVQDGVYKFVNEYMATMTGYTVRELIDKPFMDLVPAEQRDLVSQRIRMRLAGKEVSPSYETKIQGKDGTVKDVDISAGLIQYQGKPAIIKIVRDITERKRIEQELQKVQKLESLGILAGGIAHDFNNQLTAIIGNLYLMDKYIKPEQKASQTLGAIKKASQRAKHLTHQLLSFSKGGVPIKKAASISELIEETAGFSLSGSKTQCELSLSDDLWWAEIDEGQIGQVINNLVINADQAMPEGGTISISAENLIVRLSDGLPLEEGRYVRIVVKDQGPGIPETSIHKIFDPFFTTKPEGNGLGLAIVYSIVKKHGGHITVESRAGIGSSGTGNLGTGSLGTGTAFFIYLPASERELFIVQGVAEEDSLGSVSSCQYGRGRVLFMDDQPNIREMTGQMLVDLGYEVEVAREGSEAIELYEKAKELEHPFDAVILDLTVPGGMGGEETIRKLREIDPGVKAIISSGYSNDPIMFEYREYGFRDIVAKPYEIKKLSRVLHKVISEEVEILPPKAKG